MDKVLGNHDENEIIKPKYSHLETLEDAELEIRFYEILADEEPNIGSGRSGNSNETSSCTDVKHMPTDLRDMGIYHFYKKYTEAYGIPIMGSEYVSDKALERACYVVRFIFADNADVREAFFRSFGRVSVLAPEEKITSLPEYSDVLPKNYDSLRALGGTPAIPVVVVGEEMLDCQTSEDLLLRELAIGVVNIALPHLTEGQSFLQRLVSSYQFAVASNKWKNTSAALSPLTYLGEGFQSYFNSNEYAKPPDGMNNDIVSRQKLASYDPRLFNLILELKSCGNAYQHTCYGKENRQHLRINCPTQRWPEIK